MTTRTVKLVLAVCALGAFGGFAAEAVLASGDTDDSITPANTVVTASLKPGTKFVAKASVQAGALKGTASVTCTGVKFTFTTPASGLGPVDISTPVVTGCKDTFGGTDVVSTNSTNGPWTVSFVDALTDETAEKLGDTIVLGVPKAGASFSSSKLAGCTGVIAPSGPISVSGKYNDKGQLAFAAVKAPTAGMGTCTTGPTTTITATLVMSPSIHDGS